MATAGLGVLTAALVGVRDSLDNASVLLVYLLAVVVVAVIGGMVAATVAAGAAFLLANWFLTRPYYTFEVEDRDSVIALVVFLVVAFTVSATVDMAAKRRVAGLRSQLEAEILGGVTSGTTTAPGPEPVLEQVRRLFGMRTVSLVDESEKPHELARVGPPMDGQPTFSADAGQRLRLDAEGDELFGEDRSLLSRLALAAGRAYERQRLADEAARSQQLVEIDRVRSALLAAVSHDLRTPLAGIKAAVSSLRQEDISWTTDDEDEFLATIEESTDRLTDLVGDLLDMTRVQAGTVSVVTGAVSLEDVVAQALIGTTAEEVEADVPEDLPVVHTDAVLLERIVANVVDNARRHSPTGRPVSVRAQFVTPDTIRLQIVDHGPGVPTSDYETMFTPFQRLGDRSGDGVGLGLAIARGFSEAIGASLSPSATPGGGLTMTLTLAVGP
jgi:K+-sensing histidine kinase KdpD